MPRLAIVLGDALGSRRQDTVRRVADRARRLTDNHPAWSVISDAKAADYNLTVSGDRAQAGSRRRAGGQSFAYDGNVPGTAARVFADAFVHWLDEVASLEDRLASVAAASLIRSIEKLVRDLDVALNENAELRSRLAEARIEIDFLRRQVDQLSEAVKTNRPSIARAMLVAVSSILLALTTGVGEAIPGLVADTAADSDPTVEEFVQRCDTLVDAFDRLDIQDSWPRPAPDPPASPGGPSELPTSR